MAIADQRRLTQTANGIDDNKWRNGGTTYRFTDDGTDIPISSMSAEQLDSLPTWQTISPNPEHSWVRTMQNEVAARRSQLQMEEWQGAMAEMMAAMAERMNAVEDAKEPLKQAADNYESARDDVSRRQILRSGPP